MHLDMISGILTIGNKQVQLGPIEARMLEALIIAAPRPVTTNDICLHVWPYTGGPDSGTNNVTSHLWSLKGKLKNWPDVIQSRRNFGYQLTVPATISGKEKKYAQSTH
jgi:DNA-binding winged helix-turn-helix (wHTH) protein